MSPVLYLAVSFIIGTAVAACILLLTRRDRSEESEMVKRLELLDRAQEREEPAQEAPPPGSPGLQPRSG